MNNELRRGSADKWSLVELLDDVEKRLSRYYHRWRFGDPQSLPITYHEAVRLCRELRERTTETDIQPAASTPTALLRDPVKVDLTGLTRACQTCGGPFGACDCLPPLVVTRNGVPCADQKAALEEFKRAAAASTEAQDEK